MQLFWRVIVPVAVLTYAVDRVSKLWVLEVMDLRALGAIDVVAPYLRLRMAWNTGINFGLGGGGPEAMRWVLIGLAVAISAGLVLWVLRTGRRTLGLAAGLVVGGALGNAWDRFAYGAVADFVNNSCCGFDNPFSYNVADVAIFAGAIWIAMRA